MTTVTRPRGPLPARVYWTRRLLVVVVAFALVFGIAHLLGSAGSGGPSARPVGAAAPSTAVPTSGATPRATPTRKARAHGRAAKNRAAKNRAAKNRAAKNRAAKNRAAKNRAASPTPTPLAVPSGACANSDVAVTPSVKGTATGGRPVVFTMTLRTLVSPACNWVVSAQSLVVKVASGSDRVWSTQECVGAVPRQSVVVRKDQTVTVAVVWNAHRSDSDCTDSTDWAEPGYYHVIAASYGADPVDVQFELQDAVPETITATPTPQNKTKKKSR